MITFVAILIFVIASVVGFKQSKRDKKEHEDSVTLINAEELFRKTGVEIKEVDSNGKYTIIFQAKKIYVMKLLKDIFQTMSNLIWTNSHRLKEMQKCSTEIESVALRKRFENDKNNGIDIVD